MPIDYKIDASILRTTWSGGVDDAEFTGSYFEILNALDFSLVNRELADLSGIESIDLSTGAIQTVAEKTNRMLKGNSFKTAVYAPSDLGFGLARMYLAYADAGGEIVNVFRSLPEAERWLD